MDIVEVARVRQLAEDHGERFLRRCFTADEVAFCREHGRRFHERLATRFAAKEAVLKALGTGLSGGIRWTDVAVTRNPAGQPGVSLAGEAAAVAGRIGVMRWDLSLSDIKTHATAGAIASGLPPVPPEPDAAAFDQTAYRKLLSRETYTIGDSYLDALLIRSQKWCARYNALPAGDEAGREAMLRAMFKSVGERPAVMPPFWCDYGRHLTVGDRFFANFGCVFLDCAPITFGNDCFLGPGVHVYTPHHPLDPARRNAGHETSHPVTVGDNVWIGGHATLLPGVTIGDGSTVGAGSVVTKDVPPGVVAAGNPCRVIREVGEDRRTSRQGE